MFFILSNMINYSGRPTILGLSFCSAKDSRPSVPANFRLVSKAFSLAGRPYFVSSRKSRKQPLYLVNSRFLARGVLYKVSFRPQRFMGFYLVLKTGRYKPNPPELFGLPLGVC